MIEQAAPLGADGTDYLSDELLHTTCARRCRRPSIFCTRRGSSESHIPNGKEPRGHRGLHDRGERTKLVECKRTVSSKLDSGTEIELSIAASTAYTSLRTRPGRDFLERERR
jgi:hypothetical protein